MFNAWFVFKHLTKIDLKNVALIQAKHQGAYGEKDPLGPGVVPGLYFGAFLYLYARAF
jgi:hypothetical protein